MPHSNDLIQYFWLGFNILISILQVIAGGLLFRKRSPESWMILVGSILSGIFVVASHLVFILQSNGIIEWTSEAIMLRVNLISAVAALGGMLFITGLILFAIRRRSLTARIAELEQIIAAQNSRLQ